MDSADGLIEAAEATGNPSVLAFALVAYGSAFRDADPVGALNALASGSGDRPRQRQPCRRVSPWRCFWHDLRPSTATRCPHSITSLWRSATTTTAGDTTMIRSPLAVLAALFDRLGRYEPAATIAGFALSPLAAAAFPEITTAITHLRDVLGDADLRIARPQG